MSFTDYSAALFLLLLIVGSAVTAGRIATRLLAPSWPLPMRALSAAMIACAAIVLAAEVVGTFGLFSRVALVVASVVASFAIVGAARRYAEPTGADTPLSAPFGGALSVAGRSAIAAGSLVTAQWIWAARTAFRFGITDVDSQVYHLPHAARFVQDHRTTSLHYVAAGDATAYHPSTMELLHAVGMAVMRLDILSVVLSVPFLLIALLAAYCIGRRFGTGAGSLIGFAVLAAGPTFGKFFGGSAGNDYPALAFFLAAAAFVLHADQQRHRGFAISVAGVAAGLALGTKLTMVVPVLGLTLIVVWIARREPRRVVGFLAGLTLLGSYWYIRNLVHVGNPVPSVDLGVFRSPPMPLVDALGATVANHLGDGAFWRHVVPEAMRRMFGIGWVAVVLAMGGGLVAAFVSFRKKSAPARAVVWGLVLTAAATLAVYVVTPTSAGGPRDHPYLFQYNLRYAFPATMFGLVLLPAITGLARRQTAVALVGVALVAVTVTSDAALPLAACALALVLTAGATLVGARPRVIPAAAAVLLVVVAVAGFPLTRRYEHNRFSATAPATRALFHWGRSAPPGERVGVVGRAQQYAFYGPGLKTRVDYVGQHRAHHEFANFATCAGFRTALRDGHYRYLVAFFPLFDRGEVDRLIRWVRSDPSAQVVIANRVGQIIKLSGPLDPASCG